VPASSDTEEDEEEKTRLRVRQETLEDHVRRIEGGERLGLADLPRDIALDFSQALSAGRLTESLRAWRAPWWLHHPFGKSFRSLIFILKVNAELERVADHATSIAKQIPKIHSMVPPGVTIPWPTALVELSERVPAMCHQLMRAVLDEDVAGARSLVRADEIIDELEKRLFEETAELVQTLSWGHDERSPITVGLLVYRIGRELERVGDLMASVAEDVVYVATGDIIRHEKRRLRSTKG
jgi:phosphate transport system protein